MEQIHNSAMLFSDTLEIYDSFLGGKPIYSEHECSENLVVRVNIEWKTSKELLLLLTTERLFL